MENPYLKLLVQNKEWAKNQIRDDPNYFKRLTSINTPKFLFIGCSDTHLHPDTLTETIPGEIFIHRNFANLVVPTDVNFLSVLQYSIDILNVKHIIVCGHYGCGSVKVALSHISIGPLIDCWLKNIKDIYLLNKVELDTEINPEKKLNRLCELNVIDQVKNLSQTSIIQKAWKKRSYPKLHGWIYSVKDGVINPLIDISRNDTDYSCIYKYDV